MGRKSRRNRSSRKPGKEKPVGKPAGISDVRMLETIFERKSQSQIYDEIKRKHHGDVPVSIIWDHLATRRETAITTCCGAELARG